MRTLFKPTDGIISRKLNRHISLQVTRALLDTPVTPNQMTLVAMAFGLAAIGVVWYCGAAGLIAGAVLLQIQSILDGCDGEISRLKYLRSRLGEWLDQVFDDVVNLGYFAVVGYTLYAAGSSIAGWLTVLGAGAHLVYQAALYTALLTRGGGSGSVTSIRWWGQKPARSSACAGNVGSSAPVGGGPHRDGRPPRLLHLPLPALRAAGVGPDSGDLVGADLRSLRNHHGAAVGGGGRAGEGGRRETGDGSNVGMK